MAEDGEAQRIPPPVSHWQHHREPRTFTGRPDEDIDDWLKHYERVSRYNRWDALEKLANVVFFLEATALLWYENHEDSLITWDRFIDEIKACFGDGSAKKKRAEQTLLQRAQVPGETCTTYIEDVIKLCKLVNPRMSEEDKVGHLLKGIAEDVYTYLISKENLNSTVDVIRHCRTFEALKLRRITPKFGRLANVTSVASVDVTAAVPMADMIRQIVREELLRQQDPIARAEDPREGCALQAEPLTTSTSRIPTDGAPCFDGRRNYDLGSARRPVGRDITFTSEVIHRRHRPDYDDTQYPGHLRQNSDASRWRPPPACYSCGMTGHISRYCRRRRQMLRDNRPDNRRWHDSTSRLQSFNPEFQPSTSATSWGSYGSAPQRSSSPASDRSMTPPPVRQRRSPSPRRRSPPPGN